MLYLIGLGLADETDITVKGLEIVKRASRVYLEAYTSILLVDKEKLVGRLPIKSQILANNSFKETFYKRDVILADREMVESSSDEILANADHDDIAFLVVGDPFGWLAFRKHREVLAD